jgi:hypothetical protein
MQQPDWLDSRLYPLLGYNLQQQQQQEQQNQQKQQQRLPTIDDDILAEVFVSLFQS